MTEIKTPDAIIRELEQVRTHAAMAARELEKAERAYLDAKRQYEREYALAFKRADGTNPQRDQQATLDTETFAEARDDALIVLNYVKAQSKSLDSQQSNLQTQARLVEITYRLAGVGQA